VGKVANLIVTSDLPIQASAGTLHVFIRGEPVELENLHTQQRDRFALRPQPDLPAQRRLTGPPSRTSTTGPQP
jgi:hypothetical protein